MSKKVLIIYASIGAGHKSAAMAIESALKEKDKDIKVVLLDILSETKISFLKAMPELLANLSKFTGGVYNFLWGSQAIARVSSLYRMGMSKKLFYQIKNAALSKEKFDLVVTTHNLATSAISWAKNKRILNIPHIACATDLGLNVFWPKTGVDFFVVGTKEMEEELKKLSFKGKVKVFGIPTDPLIGQKIDKSKILEKYNVALDLPLVLIMAGAKSKGPYKFAQNIIKKMVDQELKSSPPFSIIIKSAGAFKDSVEDAIFKKSIKNVKTLGTISDFNHLLGCAALIVTKPGGLITAESATALVPMLLLGPYFAQERANAEYLIKKGIAISYDIKQPLFETISKIVLDKRFLAKLSQNLKKFGQKNVGLLIANLILENLK